MSCEKQNSISQDACQSASCINGGICINGTCDCLPGYNGPDCELYDSCYNVTCLNNGDCIGGICDCPVGYGGVNCELELTAVYMSISKVTLNRYPSNPAPGEGWDLTSGADVFITINPGKNPNQTDFVSSFYEDATGELIFTEGFPKKITMQADWSIGAWDHDSEDGDDYMGGFFFQADRKEGQYPTTVHCGNETSLYYFTMEVTWIF